MGRLNVSLTSNLPGGQRAPLLPCQLHHWW